MLYVNSMNKSNKFIQIPKIIMQTWKTTELPDKWKPSQSSIKKYMPDWKYVLMTDEMNRAFVEKQFFDFLPYYDDFPYPIQRADAVRYCWLYINGGLYLDCDFELLAPLDELFYDDISYPSNELFFVASSNTPNVLTNGFMACKPGNPIWLDMIEEMKKPPGISYLEQHLLVFNTTGPLSFNRVVKRSGVPFTQLPSSKINPYTICDTEFNKPDSLLKPLEGSSWVSGCGNVYQWCYCKSSYLWLILPVVFLVLLFYIFYKNVEPLKV